MPILTAKSDILKLPNIVAWVSKYTEKFCKSIILCIMFDSSWLTNFISYKNKNIGKYQTVTLLQYLQNSITKFKKSARKLFFINYHVFNILNEILHLTVWHILVTVMVIIYGSRSYNYLCNQCLSPLKLYQIQYYVIKFVSDL